MRHEPNRLFPAATIEQLEAVVAAADAYERARSEGWSYRRSGRLGYQLGDPAMYATTSRENDLRAALSRCPGTDAGSRSTEMHPAEVAMATG